MKSSLLLLFAFPLLLSCNKVDVSPKEKTTVEPTKPTTAITPSPMVGNYIKIKDDNSSHPLPTAPQLVFVDNTHQLILKEEVVNLLYTGNPAYIATQQDFSYTPEGIASVEVFALESESQYRVNITYWAKDKTSVTFTTGATYMKY